QLHIIYTPFDKFLRWLLKPLSQTPFQSSLLLFPKLILPESVILKERGPTPDDSYSY
ncbi:hypothetical protein EJ08DRAFT_604198, partial [Tothia fuscella]